MLQRRHLAPLAFAAASVAPKRAPARTTGPLQRRLGVQIASPAARGWFAGLARRVAEASGGDFRLAPHAGPARGDGTAGVLGGLAFGRVPIGAPLEPFAGFPFGMGPREVADWLGSRDGAAFWSSAHALRRVRALPCAIAVFPGWLLSARAIAGPADLSGLRVACRSDGVLGSALQDMGATPAEAAPEAFLPAVQEHAAPAPSLRLGDGNGADRHTHLYRLCPPFGAVVELSLPKVGLRALGEPFLAVLEQACAAEFDASLAGLGSAAVQRRDSPAPVPAAVAESVAARTASRLQERFNRPEAVALRVAERFTMARLAGLRFNAWA